MAESTEASTSRILLWVAVFASVAPLWCVAIAPLCDLPNHLARVHLLAEHGTAGSRYYEVDPALLPNLAIDVIATPLATLVGATAAVRIFLTAGVLATVLGAAWIARGERRDPGIAAGLAALCVHNVAFEYGLVNYTFGLGLMCVALGAWIRVRRAAPVVRMMVAIPFALALWFCHLMPLAFFAALLFAYELGAWLVRGRRHSLIAAWGVLAIVLTPVAALHVVSPAAAETSTWVVPPAGHKVAELASTFAIGDGAFDVAFTVGLAALACLLAVAMRPRIGWSAGILLATMLVLFAVAPQKTATADNISLRVPAAIALVLAAFAGLDRRHRRGTLVATLAIGALIVARHGRVAVKWLGEAEELRAVRVALASVPDGAVVFTLRDEHHRREIRGTWHPPLAHAACLSLLARDVFVPELFANPGQQWIAVRDHELAAMRYPRGEFLPTYRSPADLGVWIDTFTELATAAERSRGEAVAFLQLHADSADRPNHAALERLGHGERWTLWAVRLP